MDLPISHPKGAAGEGVGGWGRREERTKMLLVIPDRAQLVAHKLCQGNGCLVCLAKEDALCPEIEIRLYPPIPYKALSLLGL